MLSKSRFDQGAAIGAGVGVLIDGRRGVLVGATADWLIAAISRGSWWEPRIKPNTASQYRRKFPAEANGLPVIDVLMMPDEAFSPDVLF